MSWFHAFKARLYLFEATPAPPTYSAAKDSQRSMATSDCPTSQHTPSAASTTLATCWMYECRCHDWIQ